MNARHAVAYVEAMHLLTYLPSALFPLRGRILRKMDLLFKPSRLWCPFLYILGSFALSVPLFREIPGFPSSIILPIQNSSFSSSSLVNSFNSSTRAQLTASRGQAVCDSQRFGLNLNKASCLDAWARFTDSPKPHVLGQRGEGAWDVQLPVRLLSGELYFLPHPRLLYLFCKEPS